MQAACCEEHKVQRGIKHTRMSAAAACCAVCQVAAVCCGCDAPLGAHELDGGVGGRPHRLKHRLRRPVPASNMMSTTWQCSSIHTHKAKHHPRARMTQALAHKDGEAD